MGNSCKAAEQPPQVEQTTAGASEPAQDDAPAGGPKLTIKIMGARGLRQADWIPGSGASDCYCKVKAAKAEGAAKGEGEDEEACLFQTKTINNTLTPLWQEEAAIEEFADDTDLEFSVWDEDTGKKPDYLGKVILKYADFKDNGFNGELKLVETKQNKSFLRVKVKVAGKEYPDGPPAEFNIKIDKPDPKAKKVKMHGLEVDDSDGKTLYVTSMKAGPFQANNEKEGTVKMRPGDFFVKVNGVEGDSKEMLKKLKEDSEFDIVARHPDEICIAIEKKEAKTPLGVDFPKKPTGTGLLIQAVNLGPFDDWNKNSEKEHKVEAGDRIVSVAGIQGKATDLQKELNKRKSCQLIVVRPASTEKSWWLW